MNILICRDDSIGDVILTLPMAGYFKFIEPKTKVFFLGKTYTKPVVDTCQHVDEFVNADALLKLSDTEQVTYLKSLNIDKVYFAFPRKHWVKQCFKAKIPVRVGVSRRWYNWLYCNIRPSFSRKKSDLHEAQLNLKLIESLTKAAPVSKEEIIGYLNLKPQKKHPLTELASIAKQKIILHPLSQGSAIEWGLSNFNELANLLSKSGHQVFISGTEKEGQLFRSHFNFSESVKDISGKMTLAEFITFIGDCDALIAASTGPLHIAAGLGKIALGLYVNKRPIHAGRWAPLGKQALVLETTENAENLQEITPKKVYNELRIAFS